MLATIQRSKMRKIMHAFVMLVGGPFNWLLLGCGWAATTFAGMIQGALQCVPILCVYRW